MDDNKKIVIKFSLDDIKNMDLLYTYTPVDPDDFCIDGMQQKQWTERLDIQLREGKMK